MRPYEVMVIFDADLEDEIRAAVDRLHPADRRRRVPSSAPSTSGASGASPTSSSTAGRATTWSSRRRPSRRRWTSCAGCSPSPTKSSATRSCASPSRSTARRRRRRRARRPRAGRGRHRAGSDAPAPEASSDAAVDTDASDASDAGWCRHRRARSGDHVAPTATGRRGAEDGRQHRHDRRQRHPRPGDALHRRAAWPRRPSASP